MILFCWCFKIFKSKQSEVFCFNPMVTQCSGHFCLIGKCLMTCYIKSEILLTFAFVLFLLTANLRTLSVAVSHFLNCYLVSDRILWSWEIIFVTILQLGLTGLIRLGKHFDRVEEFSCRKPVWQVSDKWFICGKNKGNKLFSLIHKYMVA